ncbi:MAG: GvpL/GvpF family gas vesicle protein [Deltaproteobacteria bacterium]|nr:GvpL/GvpF family gas vesicle protein [Deltaproteobacteria bacterium]
MNPGNAQKKAKESVLPDEAIYVYCVAEGEGRPRFGQKGLEGSGISGFRFNDIIVVFQACAPDTIAVEDEGVLKSRVMAHQKVIELSSSRFGNLLPFGFGRMITGKDGMTAMENLIAWTEKNYLLLKKKLENVRGKDEYGVQVFLDADRIADEFAESSPEAARIKDAASRSSEGLAFLYREKLKKLLSAELERRAAEYFSIFYSRINGLAEEVKVEGVKKSDSGRKMIMNLSCLVIKDNVEPLGRLLEEIEKDGNLSVRFTGPWPPYSFV